MPTIVGGIRRIKGGGRDVAACFAPRIESLETDEGGGHADRRRGEEGGNDRHKMPG